MATKYIESRRVREITFNVTYANTSKVEMFTLPAGVRIIAWILNVETAFVDGTATIDMGTSDNTDYYVDGASVAAQGNAALGTALKQPGAETTEITPVYAIVGASNTAGSVDVTCLFSQEIDTPF